MTWHLAAISLSLMCACERRAELGETRAAAPASPAFYPDGAEIDAFREVAARSGADLQISAPVEVLSGDGFELERRVWANEGAAGVAWHVRLTEQGAASVLGGPGAQSFGELVDALPGGDVAAINGGFFDEHLVALDLVVSEGEELRRFRTSGGSGVFVVPRSGPAAILHRSAWPEYREAETPLYALQSIDRIVDGGESLVRERDSWRANRGAARAAVATAADGTVTLVVAAGASSLTASDSGHMTLQLTSGVGLSLADFATYLVEAEQPEAALNLDGGPSVHLFVRYGEHEWWLDGGGPTPSAVVLSEPRP